MTTTVLPRPRVLEQALALVLALVLVLVLAVVLVMALVMQAPGQVGPQAATQWRVMAPGMRRRLVVRVQARLVDTMRERAGGRPRDAVTHCSSSATARYVPRRRTSRCGSAAAC